MTNKRSESKRITIRVSGKLKREMQSAVIKAGYGLHGKSKWLKDSIAKFLNEKNYVDYVENGININQAELNEIEVFYLNQETLSLLNAALVEVRVRYPLFEGVKSAFIRSAIVYQLML